MKQKLTVVKIGGNVINSPENLDIFLKNFSRLEGPKVLVHGGGREATKVSQALGIATQMIEGRRVTDADTLEVVTMVYAGLINKRIVAKLQSLGCNSLGLTGADGRSICSVKRPAQPIDYGFVGDVTADSINKSFFNMLIDSGVVPVVSAITCDASGQLLNTNADSVATVVACGLSADYDVELTFCFEMPGVLTDVSDLSSVIPTITPSTFGALKESGAVTDGMIPKITGALNAVAAGVGRVVITRHDNLLDSTLGTRIVAE